MKRTVLYVEDQEDDIFFMRRAFEMAQLKNPLQVVEDGRAAIEYLRGSGRYSDPRKYPLPFLILLDLKLPHIPGLDVLEWIRSQAAFETMLVVVLTSSREDRDIERAYRLGANSFLVKPPSAIKLQEMVQFIGEYWFTLNEPPPSVLGR